MEILEKYIEFLLTTIMRDAEGFEHWSMYCIIPAILYSSFLILKYAALTAPIWFPIAYSLSGFNGLVSKVTNIIKK